jgi:TPR repeat protein/nucleoside-triphosphatase THEP1
VKSVANLYNPHEQSKEELIAGFVVRLKTFASLFKEIKDSDMRYPEHSYLIEGQRGMGKTTLLLRLSYEIENDTELNNWIIPLVFKEESYWGVNRLFKLWEHCAELLADKEPQFIGLYEQMRSLPEPDYEKNCFNLLIYTLEQQQKKLILFIDNIGEMFQSFNLQESQRLREVLLTCPHIRIIGATSITLESYFDYKHPFYEFFKKIRLPTLNKEETYCLLEELAKGCESEQAIQNIIKNQVGRVESLRILTGGVIRSIVLLFDIFLDDKNGDSLKDLEAVLDKVTPLYKHRMDDLSYLQREIVDAVALSWDAISPEDIATQIRRDLSEILPVLTELSKLSIIQRVATPINKDYYQLHERFFNIWYLMRIASKRSKVKVLWLVRFLQCWYDGDGLKQRAERQIKALQSGLYHPKSAFYLAEAMAATGVLDIETEHNLLQQTKAYLEKTDKKLMAELSASDVDIYLQADEFYKSNNHQQAINKFLQIKQKNEEIYARLGYLYNKLKDYKKAKENYLIAIDRGSTGSINNLAILYGQEKDFSSAKIYYLKAIKKGDANAMFNLACLYQSQENENEAIKYYIKAINKGNINAMFNLAMLYEMQKRDFALITRFYLMAIEKRDVRAMTKLGFLYQNRKKNNTLAIKYYQMAVEKGDAEAMNALAWLYFQQRENKQDALTLAEQAVSKQNTIYTRHTLACIYLWHNQFEKAIAQANNFLYEKESYENFEADVIVYLSLLLAKQQFTTVKDYFDTPETDYAERLKPLYYAFLKLSDDANYAKIPPELSEPVTDIIAKIEQMRVDYA